MILTDTLKTRPTPTQARARERVRTILQATADLLQTLPAEKITTTLIAEKAQIPVSSIYRYFPQVEDILRELYLQITEEIRGMLFEHFANGGPWRGRLYGALRMQRRYIETHPFYRPLMMVFLKQRGPVSIDDEEHRDLVRVLEERWAAGEDGFHDGNPAVVARVVLQVALTLEDMASIEPELADDLGKESYAILEFYLSRYLVDENPA